MEPSIGSRVENAIGCDGMQQKNAKNRKSVARLTLRGKVMSMAKGRGKAVLEAEKPRLRARPEKGTKMVLSAERKREALEAAQYGMPIDRIAILCGFPSGNETQWARWIAAHPEFQRELDLARAQGELTLQRRVASADTGWQAAGWMLERTRGYVARAQLDHTTKGKELSVSGSLLGAFGGQSK
jgi:hypothetical protein